MVNENKVLTEIEQDELTFFKDNMSLLGFFERGFLTAKYISSSEDSLHKEKLDIIRDYEKEHTMNPDIYLILGLIPLSLIALVSFFVLLFVK